jgi:hypothetical protein
VATLSPQRFGANRFGGPLFRVPSNVTVLTLREAVMAWLRSLSPLTSIVGQRIYKQDPSQMSLYPCIAVEMPTRDYGYNHSGADGTSTGHIQITALSSSESSAVAAIEVIRNNWQGFRGTQSGVPIMWAYLDDEADGTTEPPDGSDGWIYQAAVTYRIKHRVPAPTSVTQVNT